MILTIRILLLFTLTLSSIPVRAEYIMDAATEKLADCGDIMAYAANFALIKNNEGQARVFIFQQSRAVTALFLKNNVNEIIAGERAEAWKARSPATKRYLDANQANLPNIINGCYPIIQHAVDERIVQTGRLWGKSFADLVETMAAGTRAQFGIR
ncbi:MAG: hypothetical protein Q7T62_09500 [Undibacterium sp.]|nr:hypothetical protein [Undibacterium sp.]